MTSRAWAAFGPLLGAGVALVAACSTSSGPALGGPHGGSTFSLGPTQGNFLEADAAYTVPLPPTPAGELQGQPYTWTRIYYAYLDKGKVGNCVTCHPKEMRDPKASYKWLDDDGFMGGASPPLTQEGSSCLSWYGGDMPQNMVQSKEAVAEMNEWAHMGGQNN